ncbi:MAG: hypothetical protein LBN43_04575 [Oscillospiraceae bacterium]|nr:hypothetical protein [Oscillospiraceae bacterium]
MKIKTAIIFPALIAVALMTLSACDSGDSDVTTPPSAPTAATTSEPTVTVSPTATAAPSTSPESGGESAETPAPTAAPTAEPTATVKPIDPTAAPAETPAPTESVPTVDGALSAEPGKILTSLLAKANALLPEDGAMPKEFVTEIDAETAKGNTGLSPDDFTKYVSSAKAAAAMIGSFAHKVVIIQLKDVSDASTVKSLVADGFDNSQWICVFPEKSVVVDSGSCILMVASRKDWADAVLSAFGELAGGNLGGANEFFSGLE